jgi:hypothetical protein
MKEKLFYETAFFFCNPTFFTIGYKKMGAKSRNRLQIGYVG